jgi:ribosomal protein L37E
MTKAETPAMLSRGTSVPGKCPRCGGSIVWDDGERQCINCGHVLKSNLQIRDFYLSNKKDILRDIKLLGAPATRKKWRIPSSTFSILSHAWEREASNSSSLESKDTTPSSGLPPMPSWNDDWPELVQCLWLHCWLYVATGGKDGGNK